MKKLLPKIKFNPKGFTLVELLVVVTIIAILSVIGIAVFSGVQKNARDARRRGDVNAIGKALEAQKPPTSSTYVGLLAADFTANAVPDDSLGASTTALQHYCIATLLPTDTATTVADPTDWASNTTTGCPTAPTGYSALVLTPAARVNGSANGSKYWKVCSRLETSTGASGTALQTYCSVSSQ